MDQQNSYVTVFGGAVDHASHAPQLLYIHVYYLYLCARMCVYTCIVHTPVSITSV